MSGTERTNVGLSATWTFFEDDWHAGDVRIMGPRAHTRVGSAPWCSTGRARSRA
jgi:hypothetical protein